MLIDIIKVKPLDEYRLYLKFENGVEGEVDFAEFTEFDGVYEPLKDPQYFKRVKVNPEWGTIYWPNEASPDPVMLYAAVTKDNSAIKQVAISGTGT